VGRRSLVVICALFALVAAQATPASAAKLERRTQTPKPVASLTPRATAKLWKRLVQRRKVFHLRDVADCRPLRAILYAQTDWLRLATKLAANPSPCAQYYVSVPPLAADKTAFRYDQPWRIRALGSQFHVLAEIHVGGWSNWVSTTGSSWYDAGVEARRRMAAANFDVAAGDSWALNELSSAVRRGDGQSRANMRAFIHGLYDGDGTLPAAGVVWTSGISQGTTELSVYRARLQDWYEDGAFWSDMSAYVSDWSQELYGDIRNYAVPGAVLAARRDALSDYLQHEVVLAHAAPESAATARAFLDSTYSPLANSAWTWDAAYGWTNVSYDLMQQYVSAQTYALRQAGTSPLDRFGFAWSPKNLNAVPSADFTAQTAAILDRLAAAIRDSAEDVDATDSGVGACGALGQTTWCGGDVSGSWFNNEWKSLATWSPSRIAFTSAPQALVAGAASQPITIEYQTSTGLSLAAGLPLTLDVVSSSPGGTFATTPDGPWDAKLTLSIASGSASASFYYRDTNAGDATLTAAAAGKTSGTQVESVALPDATPPETTLAAAPSGLVA
jgi:hypothetical protein